MHLRAVYRSTGRENQKPRPTYYSKRLCLESFLRSMQASGVGHDIVFLNDGPIPTECLDLMHSAGEVVALAPPSEAPVREVLRTGHGGSGMAHSYLAALALVDEQNWPDTDLVYLAEDDYLYRDDAFEALAGAAEEMPGASYFSLYATVDVPRCDMFFVKDEPWASAVTATSTFGARVGALRADRWIHRIAWFATPRIDQSISEAYQGSRPFPWNRVIGDLLGGRPAAPDTTRDRVRRGALQVALNLLAVRAGFRPHLLVTPFIPFATHLALPFVAPGTDWEAIARETEAWSSSAVSGLRDRAPRPSP